MLTRQHKVLNPGRIIAELNFGFWTCMLDKRYKRFKDWLETNLMQILRNSEPSRVIRYTLAR